MARRGARACGSGGPTKTNMDILGTSTGVVNARTVKQLPKGEDADMELFRAMRRAPWNTSMKADTFKGENWTPTEGCPGCEYAEKG